jgi:hypothetical protein
VDPHLLDVLALGLLPAVQLVDHPLDLLLEPREHAVELAAQPLEALAHLGQGLGVLVQRLTQVAHLDLEAGDLGVDLAFAARRHEASPYANWMWMACLPNCPATS